MQEHGVRIIAATLASTIYLLLTIAALLSAISPLLSTLSSHGKTRISNRQPPPRCQHKNHNGQSEHDGAGVIGKVTRLLLTSDALTVNKRRFIDFYAAGIIVTFLLLAHAKIGSDSYYYASIINSENHWQTVEVLLHQWLPTFLLLMHLLRRYCECKWIQKSQQTSRMHLTGYLLGILHYICLALVLVPIPHLGCTTVDIGSNEMESNNVCETNSQLDDIQYTFIGKVADILAMVGCIYFQYQQHRHHILLANLRKTKSETAAYSIPMGGWFEYVSCPHYLAEIMIYVMFAILLNNASSSGGGYDTSAWIHQWISPSGIPTAFISRDNCAAFLIAIYETKHWILLMWVVANLSVSASRSHSWYHNNYRAAYPQQRKRLVPFLW